MNKKMLLIIILIFVNVIIGNNLYAISSGVTQIDELDEIFDEMEENKISNPDRFGDGFDPSYIPSGNRVTEIDAPVQRAWGTISLILQICAVGGIIFAGVRYMFATADAKSDIKKTLPYIIIGCVIVFAAPIIINFVVDIFAETTGT